MSALINPTFWLAVAVLVTSVRRLDRRAAHFAALLKCATSGPVLVLVGLLTVANLCARVAIGLAVPGDFVQEVVAARSFQNDRTLFAHDINHDVAEWLRMEPPVVPAWLPNVLESYLRERQTIGRNRLVAQAHPPTLLLAVAPLIWLVGPRSAYVVLTAVSIGSAVIVSQLLLTAWRPNASRRERWLAALTLVAWQPVLAAVRDGQVSIVVGAALVAAWSTARTGAFHVSGALVGIASALKLYPGALLVLLAVRRRTALWVAVLTIAGAGLVVTAAAGIGVWGDYFASAQTIGRAFASSSHNLSAVARLAPALPADWLPFSYVAVSAALLGVTLRAVGSDRWGNTAVWAIDVDFALFICLAMLLSPVAWHHYTFMLVLPLAVALIAARRERPRWPLACWALGALVLTVPDDVIRQMWATLSLPPVVIGLSSPGAAILLLWASLVYVRRTIAYAGGLSVRHAAPASI